ncbi:MAG: hypothetical protein WDA09_08200 [Bacteriovoracaceae bacterium]
MKKIYILAVLLFMGQSSWAQIRDYQTTRLLSTSGAGVASILTTEAAILNPSSAAFFEQNTASAQVNQVSLSDKADDRTKKFSNQRRSQGYFISDNKGPVKGGLAYIQQNENHYKRERMSMHAASVMGKNASFGINYQYLQDTFPSGHKPRRDFSHVVNAGLTYILSNDLIIGAVARDLTRTLTNEEKALVGLQYVLTDKVNLIFDYGFFYTKGFNNKFQWAGAVQLALFKDVYLRGGMFEDQITHFKGYSWGASWVGPRLGVEFAQRFSEQTSKGSYIYSGETLVDSSLSLFLTF